MAERSVRTGDEEDQARYLRGLDDRIAALEREQITIPVSDPVAPFEQINKAVQVARFADGPNTAFDTALVLPFNVEIYADGGSLGSDGIVIDYPGVWHISCMFGLGFAPGGIGGQENAELRVLRGAGFIDQRVVQYHAYTTTPGTSPQPKFFNLAMDAPLIAGDLITVSATMLTPTDPGSVAVDWFYDSNVLMYLSAHWVHPPIDAVTAPIFT